MFDTYIVCVFCIRSVIKCSCAFVMNPNDLFPIQLLSMEPFKYLKNMLWLSYCSVQWGTCLKHKGKGSAHYCSLGSPEASHCRAKYRWWHSATLRFKCTFILKLQFNGIFHNAQPSMQWFVVHESHPVFRKKDSTVLGCPCVLVFLKRWITRLAVVLGIFPRGLGLLLCPCEPWGSSEAMCRRGVLLILQTWVTKGLWPAGATCSCPSAWPRDWDTSLCPTGP